MDTIAFVFCIVAIVVLVFSLLWFVFGTTAFFQRGVDLVETVQYVVFWTPVLIFTIAIIFVLVLKQDWVLRFAGTASAQRILVSSVAFIAILSAGSAIHLAPTAGWLTERVEGDVIQITSDGKYEYRTEVVNQFQKNACVRLYIRDITTENGTTIRLSAKAEEISARATPHPPWSDMTPTEQDGIYLLRTADGFGSLLIKKATFEIDIASKTSRRIE